MSELKFGFRSVKFLLFVSSFFTCLLQSICNVGCDLTPALYNVKQKKDVALVSKYINTNTSNIIPTTSFTTAKWIENCNCYIYNSLSDAGTINLKVNCTYGDSSILMNISSWYSYPSGLPWKNTFTSWTAYSEQHSGLNWSYSSVADFDVPSDTILPHPIERDTVDEDNQPSIKTCPDAGLSIGAIVGITLGVVAVVLLFLARCLYNGVYREKINAGTSLALLKNAHVQLIPLQAPNGSSNIGSESCGALAAGLTDIFDKAVLEFSYEELSKATNDFSLGNKIGQGGFGAVYYAELRGKKAAIKKMDTQASKEFITELKVLSNVHHLNLVPLIGYCVKGFHFLVYEYIENGNLSQHLHEPGNDPLPWSTRVQIALDSARGLEYIHEYTISVFIHCDIKSANILIDKNFRGKVADFGLTRLTDVRSRSRLMGTFGYMSPEYAQYGDVSPKVDVYAFGVVLYELISAKRAIIRENGSAGEPKGLVALFDEVFSQADPKDNLVKMIDPRLGDNYPMDSVHKMAQLAKACTHDDPQRRPHMRSIVVALMTLLSSTKDG